MPAQSSGVRKEQKRVARLEDKVKKIELKKEKKKLLNVHNRDT